MMPAYLQKDFKSLSYFSGTFVLFALIAIIALTVYDSSVIHSRKGLSKINFKVFDMA
jgi:hypothetical protein